jgi:hypothetical protein
MKLNTNQRSKPVWPGTRIRRSTGNAFDLRTAGELTQHMLKFQGKSDAGRQGADAGAATREAGYK